MSARMRTLAYGTAAAMVLAGGLCAALVPGVSGEVLTIALIAGGLAGALLLVFLEIGLGEERDLERDHERERERQRTRSMRALEIRRRSRLPRGPRRPS